MSMPDALIEAGGKGINNNIFKRLLEEADKGDLQATQNHEEYADQSEEFRAAIKGAFSTAKPRWHENIPSSQKSYDCKKRSLKTIQNLEYSKKSRISLLLTLSTILTIIMEKGQMLPRRLLTKSLVPLLQPIGLAYMSLAMWVWMRKTWWIHDH